MRTLALERPRVCAGSKSGFAVARPGFNLGFTLLEMLAVLAVIGLASALVAPRIVGRLDGIDERAQIRSVADQLRQLPRRVRLEGRELWLASSAPNAAQPRDPLQVQRSGESLLNSGTVLLGADARRAAEPAALAPLDLRSTLGDGLPAVELPPHLRLEALSGRAPARIGARGTCEPAWLELQRLRDDGRTDAVLARFRYSGLNCELEIVEG